MGRKAGLKRGCEDWKLEKEGVRKERNEAHEETKEGRRERKPKVFVNAGERVKQS